MTSLRIGAALVSGRQLSTQAEIRRADRLALVGGV
jgi:hypothetical protein